MAGSSNWGLQRQDSERPLLRDLLLTCGCLGAAPGTAGTWPWVLSDTSFGGRTRRPGFSVVVTGA